jgi:2'-5' RNA ligase
MSWFVAFPIDLERALQIRAAMGAPPAATSVLAAEDLHLTLAFLGSVPETRAREGLGRVQK